MTATIGPERSYQSEQPTGRDGFTQLLHAEWTKFRTVRGWVIGTLATALIVVILAVVSAEGNHASTCINDTCTTTAPKLLLGPDGEAVNDSFYFVHQPLAGDGSITARATSVTGLYSPSGGVAGGVGANGQAALTGMKPGLQPWTKTGLIITAATKAGSAYAAIMITGSHGVRMQYNYTHDIAGPIGTVGTVSTTSPRWLRLTRTGDTITGSESPDGTHWATIGTAHLSGLGASAQAGVFAASPDHNVTSTHLGGDSGNGGPTLVTGTFDHVALHGGTPAAAWTGVEIGGGQLQLPGIGFHQTNTASGAELTVTGTGDIAPTIAGSDGSGTPVEQTLVGAFAALILVIVLATLFITGEYRRGLIRTTLAATPRRGRVLAAKAVVLAAVTFVAGVVAAVIAVPVGEHLLRANGNAIYPISSLTEVRVIVGTAALLAVVAVLALAVATLLRRAAATVAIVAAAVVLPYLLAVAFVLPAGPAGWLLRITPAAGFAIQQSVTHYAQVAGSYNPANGYYPLSPLAGFAVLCAWTALTFGAAVVLIRRRDS
jgi:ABC-type transport system involved in multi-copper enzyme maturation permease subunit